jgi:hypothetical protein
MKYFWIFPPSAPQNLKISRLNYQTLLSWDDNPEFDIDHYEIFRKLDPDPFHPQDPKPCWYLLDSTDGRVNEYIDPDFCPYNGGGAEAWYKIKAVDYANNESPYSVTISSNGYIRLEGLDSLTVKAEANDFQSLKICPNPFNSKTVLSFQLQDASLIELEVFDITGREVDKVAEGYYPAGEHKVAFNGEGLSSGIYFAVLKAGEAKMTQKLLLLK